jgi:hypothetical protein
VNAGQFKKGQPAWNKGIKNSTGWTKTRFKKGQTNWNHRPVSSERIDSEGYVYIKVSEPSKWRLKHRIIYEQHHGEIPEGSIICFFDNNKQNLEITNLFCVTRQENAYLAKTSFSSEPIELKKTLLSIMRLKKMAIKKQKEVS